MNETIKLLKSHTSIRKFKDKKIDEKTIETIIECAQSASTSSFVQAYSIIQVKDKNIRKQIAKLSGDQKYIEECPLFLVFCGDLNRLGLACEINGTDMKSGYTESFLMATVDTALAGQNAMIAAESVGLGGVYIGGVRNNPSEICKLLSIPNEVYPVFGMCIGYPNQSPEVKPRLPIDVVFKTDRYNIEEDKEKIKNYDELAKEYYLKRTKGKRDDKWTEQMSEKMGNELRPHMRKFLKDQGFEMK